MTPPLHTLIALRDGVQSRKHDTLTAAHKLSQKTDLYAGFTRTYRPKDDEGDRLPSESKAVQLNADHVLGELIGATSQFWDLTATVDTANQHARADVTLPDGTVLLTDVPATTLLFLAKQLDDVFTFVRKLPTLDSTEVWEFDPAVGVHATKPSETVRQKKVPRNHVKAPATERHPAQVEMYFEDVLVGYWTTVKHSGALEVARQRELLRRINVLRDVVKTARERANTVDAPETKIADPIFSYLFGGS